MQEQINTSLSVSMTFFWVGSQWWNFRKRSCKKWNPKDSGPIWLRAEGREDLSVNRSDNLWNSGLRRRKDSRIYVDFWENSSPYLGSTLMTVERAHRSECEAARWGWGLEGSHRTLRVLLKTTSAIRDSREVRWWEMLCKRKFKVGDGSDALNFDTLFFVQPSGTTENGHMLCSTCQWKRTSMFLPKVYALSQTSHPLHHCFVILLLSISWLLTFGQAL